jgi:hypothetical protein
MTDRPNQEDPTRKALCNRPVLRRLLVRPSTYGQRTRSCSSVVAVVGRWVEM